MKAPTAPVWTAPQNWTCRFRRPEANESFQVVVIGGGLQGVSAALHAARRGLSVGLVEAGTIASGASGANGGQVIPGLKYDPETLIRTFGEARGERLASFAGQTADRVFDLIHDEGLAVPHERRGWIQAAHRDEALEPLVERNRQWQARGAKTRLLDRQEVAEMTGTGGYAGGWLDPRAGMVDPLALTLELARLASEAGVAIGEGVRARKLINISNEWSIELSDGLVLKARKVIVATNAYSDGGLIPGLARSLVPLHSFQVATSVLPAELRAEILPARCPVSDSRRLLNYFRQSADGRFVLGGRGSMSVPIRPEAWAHLERSARRLFPALEGIPFERRWFGRVGVTPDHLPHLHEPAPGLLAVAGCQGRGVALMTALGPYLARYCEDGDAAQLPLPITPIRPIPFHRLRNLGVGAVIAWYRLLDGLER